MKTIDNIKYRNVYKKASTHFKEMKESNKKCFICQIIIIDGEKHFREDGIFVSTLDSAEEVIEKFYPICTECVSSSKEAEKVVIPLLKILYGGKIRVLRHSTDKITTKSFYY
jgi:hypothetical protein